MNAHNPVPTIAQRRELDRFVQRHYPARQYADNQPAFAEVAAAGVACCATDGEEDTEITIGIVLGWCAYGIAAMGVWAAVGYATWWAVGFFFGANP